MWVFIIMLRVRVVFGIYYGDLLNGEFGVLSLGGEVVGSFS